MGLLSNTTQAAYNTPSGLLHGTYQFVSLQHIVSSFMFTYVGESKIINKVNRAEVQFHGMRAIQELVTIFLGLLSLKRLKCQTL